MEKEGPHAWHAATVVYHSRDVTGKDGDGKVQSPFSIPPIAQDLVPSSAELKTGALTTPSGASSPLHRVRSFWAGSLQQLSGSHISPIPTSQTSTPSDLGNARAPVLCLKLGALMENLVPGLPRHQLRAP